ncbi:aladin [Macadamia integrifolia]|uniref:aladin n=1 Tax=Macadamia integrifolia TaxID=60698 RepID=UPI001C4F69E5|nr:aladin [Macadamia integrifolia]
MPAFPHPGSVTLCEINRDLITVESLTDGHAKDTYGKVLGFVFSPVPFQSDLLLPGTEHGFEQENGDNVPRGLTAFSKILCECIKRYLPPTDVSWLWSSD